MTTNEIVNAIKSGKFEAAELAEIAGAALAAGLDGEEVDADEFIEEADAAAGCRMSTLFVDRYRADETIHNLIRLVVERGGPGRTTDQVHEMALHHWTRDGLDEVERTLAAVMRDIRQRERMGLPFPS